MLCKTMLSDGPLGALRMLSRREKDLSARGVAIFPFIQKVAVIMVTLSENSAECSSTTPQISDREHFGSNIVSSTNNEREFLDQLPI